MEELEKYKSVLFEAADEAGKILREAYNTDFEIKHKKEYSDLVTAIDKKSEAKIIEIIHKHFPEHNVLGEEGGNMNMQSDYNWIVDPIDGTVNFAHALPIFCVSIALEIKKEVVIGIVFSPMLGEKFWAEKGKGSYLNDKKISVSGTDLLKDSLL